jgi:hypothetical protein
MSAEAVAVVATAELLLPGAAKRSSREAATGATPAASTAAKAREAAAVATAELSLPAAAKISSREALAVAPLAASTASGRTISASSSKSI